MSRMPIDPDFEPRVADWLEADPDTRRGRSSRPSWPRSPRSHSGAPRACRGGSDP